MRCAHALQRQAAWARRRSSSSASASSAMASMSARCVGAVALDVERRLAHLEQTPAQRARAGLPALCRAAPAPRARGRAPRRGPARLRACSAARVWYSAALASSPASSKCLAAAPRKSFARSPVAPASQRASLPCSSRRVRLSTVSYVTWCRIWCLKAYSRRSSLLEPARGSASSRRTSAGKVSWAFVSSAIRARSQNTGPMTLACCRVAVRAPAGRRGGPAARRSASAGPWSAAAARRSPSRRPPVSIAPWSISILTSSSM